MTSSSASVFKQLCLAEVKYKQLKTWRVNAEDKLQQASHREQRLKKEIAHFEAELGRSPSSFSHTNNRTINDNVSAAATQATDLAKTLTELNIQLRQQQCFQEAMKGESQFAAQEASKVKLDIEMLHSKLRSQFGTAIVTTPRGKMNSAIFQQQGTREDKLAAERTDHQQQPKHQLPLLTSTEFSTSVITMIGEIAQLQMLHNTISYPSESEATATSINADSSNNSARNQDDSSSAEREQQQQYLAFSSPSSWSIFHPLVPYAPASVQIPSFSQWDSTAASMATSVNNRLAQCHRQLVASLNIIGNSCTNLSDDKDQWSTFVDMIASAFADACESLLASALQHVLDILSGTKRPRELFAIQARLSQTCQVVFSPSPREIGVAIRNAVHDRFINDTFKFPHLASVLTKKADSAKPPSKPFHEMLAEKLHGKFYVEIDRCVDRIEKDMDLAQKDIVGEYGYAFSPDIVNLTSAQLFNTQLKLESSFHDRFPLARGGLQVNCSPILDTSIQLLAQQRKKAKEAEKAKRVESFLLSSLTSEKDSAKISNFSTYESCRAAPPKSIVPNRSQQDDDLEKLLSRIPSLTSRNAVVASPHLPEVWNRVAAPEHTPAIIVPLEPTCGRTTPPPAGRARAMRENPPPPLTSSSSFSPAAAGSSPTPTPAATQERYLDKISNGQRKVEDEEEEGGTDAVQDEDQLREIKRRQAREVAERLANQMKQSAGFFSGGVITTGPPPASTSSRGVPPLHPNSGGRALTSARDQSAAADDEDVEEQEQSQHHFTSSVSGAQQPAHSGRPSSGPVSKSRSKTNAAVSGADLGEFLPAAALPPPLPQSLTPQDKPKRSFLTSNSNNNNTSENNTSSQRKSPTPPTSGRGMEQQKQQQQNHHSQSDSPTFVSSRPTRIKMASRIDVPTSTSNNQNESQDRRQSSCNRNDDEEENVEARRECDNDDDDELEILRLQEQKNVERMKINERKFLHLQMSLQHPQHQQGSPIPTTNNNNNINNNSINNKNNNLVVGAYGVVPPAPYTARTTINNNNSSSSASTTLEREVADPQVLAKIRETQGNRSSNSAPNATQGLSSSSSAFPAPSPSPSPSIFQRPKLSAFTQQQIQLAANAELNRNLVSSPSPSSLLPSIHNQNNNNFNDNNGRSNNNKGMSPAVPSGEAFSSTVHQQRAEREIARREAEAVARRQEVQDQIEEEQLEKELARKLKAIEVSSEAKNQNLIRAASREGTGGAGGGSALGVAGNRHHQFGHASNFSSGVGGLDLPPLQPNGGSRNGTGVTTYNSSSTSAVRPSSSHPYTLSPEKSSNTANHNQKNISVTTTTTTATTATPMKISESRFDHQQQQQQQTTPSTTTTTSNFGNGGAAGGGGGGSALRRKLSLPGAASSSATILSSASNTVIESHEAASLSHLEVYKLACSRLSIKPNSGVVRMLPKNPGEHVTSINLDTNYIGNRGFVPLLEVLRVNRGLQFLNLRDNNLESPQISLLCEALMGAAGDHVCQINLSNNPITPAGAASLSELIQRRPNLTSVSVKDTLIQGKTAEHIAELCLRNSLKKKSGKGEDVDEL